LYWGPDVVYDPYVYDDAPDYGPGPSDDNYGPGPSGDNYGPPPPSSGSYGAPPASADNYNCSAWRWDENAKKYVQVRAACN
jgi:hypothetical protein